MAPNEGNMNTLQEFLGVSRAQAIILLEKYDNVEQAMNQYFENPTSAVKPQAPVNQWIEPDNIPYADDTSEMPVAMSRPPSRVDQRAADAARIRLPPHGDPSTMEDMQDVDLQRAIAMSRQDLPDQETGVIESEQQFGPANRPYYDTSQWAMTTIASSREVVDHPPPSKRQRLSGQPAFLRGTQDTGYLAPLLNIYHNIPLAREAFLLDTMPVLTYGHDPQWWSGTSDENTKSLSMETSDRVSQDRHNFLAEMQCLMAFLDNTDRAYGSVDALADLRAMKMYNSETQSSRLLETWVAAAMTESPDNQLTQIFTSTAIKAAEADGYSPIQRDLVCLEPTVRRGDGQTLVNLLDATIWADAPDKFDDIWLQQCAEVFTMRLYDNSNENKGLGLEIPAIWYPDRYMYDYRDMTRQWRQEVLALRHEIGQCVLIQQRCQVAQGPRKRVIKIRDVLEAASKLAGSGSESSQESESVSDEVPRPPVADAITIHASDVQSQLQAILQKIDEKVKVLEARKTELQNRIKAVASQLTQPTSDPTLTPRHKYFLQGVSTKPNITYIRRRNGEPQTLINTAVDDDTLEFQWWRTVWGKDDRVNLQSGQAVPQQSTTQNRSHKPSAMDNDSDSEQSYSVRPVQESEVLEAARTESNSIVLVYANENAMNLTPSLPTTALRKFVEQDNRAFQEEINRESGDSRRRYSEDTNTTIMEDVPVDNRSTTPNNLRETTPMSMTSPLRDADGQPSPKRAKGDESYVYHENDSDDDPPPYDRANSRPSAPEKTVSKIGMLADQMLEKYSDAAIENPEKDDPVHIEHAREPLR